MNKAHRILLTTAVILGIFYAFMSQNNILKIFSNGNLRIGTSTTTPALDVNGSMKRQELALSDSPIARLANFKGGLKKSTGSFTGNATVIMYDR